MDIPRLKPHPLPDVHPLPEYAVGGQRAIWYAEMKADLQVPWMGVVTMAFAHYPTFFEVLWRGLRPLVTSRAFVDEARALRDIVETGVGGWSPPSIHTRLSAMGYGERELREISDVNVVFSHGNHLYALIATAARLLLEEVELNGIDISGPGAGRHCPPVDVPFVLMEMHHADAPTRALFEDVKSTLGLPIVNTDYRAFARWPSYWAAAWADLREVVGTDAHETLCRQYHDRMCASLRTRLPNPGRLMSSDLIAAARSDTDLDEILAVVRLFQWLLPGLAVNVAYLGNQLIKD